MLNYLANFVLFVQTHHKILYLKEIFQNIQSQFIETLDHLQKYPTLVDDSKATTPSGPISQDHS